MADLDEFFAKKAKKKTKKKQYTTSSTIAKNIEAQQQAELLREQEKLQAPEKPAHANPEDEKWRDFEEDQKPKDLSGLKILDMKKGPLQQDQKQESEEQTEKSQVDEGDPQAPKSPSESSGGPWQMSNEPPAAIPSAEVEKPEEKSDPVVAPTKYRPGAFSAMKNQSKQGLAVGWRSRKMKPPDVTSVEDFPSLQGATAAATASHDDTEAGEDDFEKVEGGFRDGKSRLIDSGPPQIKLGNKFDALDSSSS